MKVTMDDKTPAIVKRFPVRPMLVLGTYKDHILYITIPSTISERSEKARDRLTCGYILFRAYSERRFRPFATQLSVSSVLYVTMKPAKAW